MAAEQAIRCLSEDKQCHNTTAMLKSDHMKVIVLQADKQKRGFTL